MQKHPLKRFSLTEPMPKIKQLTSCRFGVPHYLADPEVLQIKIAQGTKSGGLTETHQVLWVDNFRNRYNRSTDVRKPPIHAT